MIEPMPSRGHPAALLRSELPEVFSLTIFLVGTALLFRSWEFALIVTASLGFHELGHAAAIGWVGLEYRIHFGVIGAWTWTRLEDRAGLSQMVNVVIHLAGPLFSLVLALVALGLDAWWQPDSPHLKLLANFSAQTGLLNLLPLGTVTDGGKALRRMAASARACGGRSTLLLLMGSAVLLPVLWVLATFLQAGSGFSAVDISGRLWGLVLIGAWLAAGVLSEIYRGGRTVMASSRPMSSKQVVFFTLLLWDMLAAFLLVIEVTPFWLSPQYVVGALQNMALLMGWFFSLI